MNAQWVNKGCLLSLVPAAHIQSVAWPQLYNFANHSSKPNMRVLHRENEVFFVATRTRRSITMKGYESKDSHNHAK
jgi:hypothetical protein